MIAASDLHISLIASLPEAQRTAILSQLSDEEAQALLHDWRFWARPNQLPPEGDWFCWMLRSGRGYGKTRAGAQWVIHRAEHGPYYPIALIGQTKADARDTMVELGESSILQISPPWFRPHYEPSKRRVIWPNGMIAVIYSGDEPDQLRGPQHGSVWVDELAKFKYPQETWDNMELGLRLGDRPQVVVTTTPRPIKIIRQVLADPDTVDVVGSSYENVANLSPRYIQRVIKRYDGTRLGRQEIHGELLTDVPGALWTHDLIDRYRVKEQPDLARIVIAIDPAASSSEESDETGIITGGIGVDGHGYVLADLSLSDTPAKWGRRAIDAYHLWRADRIVGERNNGGEMVENTLRTIRDDDDQPIGRDVSYKSVWASRGKVTRAEPVSSLYEQGWMHHVGIFPELEDQMTTWLPGEKSPDRVDALVWCFHELLLGGGVGHTFTVDW
jgi:phage terminase large subunit-like protein